jgi:hypothetical protein
MITEKDSEGKPIPGNYPEKEDIYTQSKKNSIMRRRKTRKMKPRKISGMK